ncbi:MAG: penicillin acylase family protein [Sphingobacteriales bacterium]
MRTLLISLICLISLPVMAQRNIDRWEKQASQVTIIRDEYGIPHIYGKTDADCVFGLLYAQCEDDFRRVEENYITMLGRTAEVKGKSELYEDLLIRLTIDSAEARKDYEQAPDWLKKILQAYADGINFYLYKHPEVKPALIKNFEPWFPLMYTDGSISAIQTGGLTAEDIKHFYENENITATPNQRHIGEEKLIGSNGFAVAPSKSKTGNALFFINPHVTFYFRPEVHMQSEEGLHVYGAVTWGQPFIYQGFNEHLGFMHTSSEADAADLYAETIVTGPDGHLYYRYNGENRRVKENLITLRYIENGIMKSKQFITYATHHGPVLAQQGEKWLSLKTMNRSLAGLIQSWERTKATSIELFKKNLDLRANLSNNTVYADKKGNIAYWHGNYMPKRDLSFNWNQPVDGSTSKTEWKGMHTVSELVQVINPRNGWIQNTNNTPFSVSGDQSPKSSAYPSYMAPDGENFRGLNAVRLFNQSEKMDIDDLIKLGYDPHLTAFDSSLPVLIAKHATIKNSDPALYKKLEEPIAMLAQWDRNASVSSVAQTLAIHWAEKMNALLRTDDPELFADFITRYSYILRKTDEHKILQPLAEVIDSLQTYIGTWKIPWGEINRLQRIQNGSTTFHLDNVESIPVGRASSVWGQLPSFNSRTSASTKKRYGYGGNSFVCAVEFGKRIRAKSILAGGNSGDPNSPHFFDQAKMYADGQFKEVHFYKDDVLKHAMQTYHPGTNVASIEKHLPLIDSLVSQYAQKNNIPGFTYGIVSDGKLIHTKYAGLSNIKENIKVDSLSAFRIASMTKSFTTMAILMLRDQGKVNLDDPASKYIPQMKNTRLLTDDAPEITIRDLMTHRAGFPEDNPFGDRQMGNTDKQLEDLMEKGVAFSTIPGINYEYSNLGISLLGLVIRNVTGKTYQDYIIENIFKPLGMNNTYWDYTKVPSKQLALGYRWINHVWEEQELEKDGSWGAMGGVITTIEDFSKYMNFHLSAWPPRSGDENGPIKRSSVREMHQAWNYDNINPNFKYPTGRACPTTNSYGYGLGIMHDCQNRVYVSHGGGLPGFGSHWRIMPQYGMGIAIFSNRTYAGWGSMTLQTLDTLIALSHLESRKPNRSEILEKRKEQVVKLFPDWKNAAQTEIFAENFFPDNPLDQLKKQSSEHFSRIGTIKNITSVRPLNALRGEFDIIGEKGKITVFFTLSPETDPKIQAMVMSN